MIGTFTFEDNETDEIIGADVHRDHITIQQQSTNKAVFLAFGEPAKDGFGIELMYPGCSVRVTGAKARQAVNGICAATDATLGIETTEDVEYRPGSYIWV